MLQNPTIDPCWSPRGRSVEFGLLSSILVSPCAVAMLIFSMSFQSHWNSSMHHGLTLADFWQRTRSNILMYMRTLCCMSCCHAVLASAEDGISRSCSAGFCWGWHKPYMGLWPIPVSRQGLRVCIVSTCKPGLWFFNRQTTAWESTIPYSNPYRPL